MCSKEQVWSALQRVLNMTQEQLETEGGFVVVCGGCFGFEAATRLSSHESAHVQPPGLTVGTDEH